MAAVSARFLGPLASLSAERKITQAVMVVEKNANTSGLVVNLRKKRVGKSLNFPIWPALSDAVGNVDLVVISDGEIEIK